MEEVKDKEEDMLTLIKSANEFKDTALVNLFIDLDCFYLKQFCLVGFYNLCSYREFGFGWGVGGGGGCAFLSRFGVLGGERVALLFNSMNIWVERPPPTVKSELIDFKHKAVRSVWWTVNL